MDMVFPSTIGTPIDPTNLLKKFRQSLKKAGLTRLRFHDLRHTSATLMLNNGVDVLVASKRLGHAKPSITLDVYGHLLSLAQDEVADKMDSLLSI
jgi:integrase